MEERAAERVTWVPAHGAGQMAPTFTSETAVEAGRKSGLARKGKPWSWEQRAAHIVRTRGRDGERTHDTIIRALVAKAQEGDVQAINLLARMSGWTEKREVRTTTERRELRVSTSGAQTASIEQSVTSENVTDNMPYDARAPSPEPLEGPSSSAEGADHNG